MNRYNELKSLLESFEQDFKKFYDKGNASAGTRLRQGMQAIKEMAQDTRKEVQGIKKDPKKKGLVCDWPGILD